MINELNDKLFEKIRVKILTLLPTKLQNTCTTED